MSGIGVLKSKEVEMSGMGLGAGHSSCTVQRHNIVTVCSFLEWKAATISPMEQVGEIGFKVFTLGRGTVRHCFTEGKPAVGERYLLSSHYRI